MDDQQHFIVLKGCKGSDEETESCLDKLAKQELSSIQKSTYHDEKSGRFISLVYRALASELITFSKASELLNESINVVREQLALV